MLQPQMGAEESTPETAGASYWTMCHAGLVVAAISIFMSYRGTRTRHRTSLNSVVASVGTTLHPGLGAWGSGVGAVELGQWSWGRVVLRGCYVSLQTHTWCETRFRSRAAHLH